jgi:Arc/MetJ-type ribon-helix-helix transcriptional regulator
MRNALQTHYMSRLVQVRLPEEQVEKLNRMVEQGRYASRSEAVRDGVNKIIDWGVGTIPNTGDSVEEVRKIRQEMGVMTAEEINSVRDRLERLR